MALAEKARSCSCDSAPTAVNTARPRNSTPTAYGSPKENPGPAAIIGGLRRQAAGGVSSRRSRRGASRGGGAPKRSAAALAADGVAQLLDLLEQVALAAQDVV